MGIEGSDYRVEPPLPGFGVKIPVNDMEVQLLEDHYDHDPHALATRTPNIFFAALTVALLAAWVARVAGHWWLALLAAAVYATSPETFVRSSYGGYFAISQLALLEILLAVETAKRANGFVAGGFAALACHKLVFLPATIAVWEAIRLPRLSIAASCLRPLRHPVVLGFAAGTLLYWGYGLSINAAAFWQDHVHSHFLDRIMHVDPFHYSGYPSPLGLWREFCEHTGYLLLRGHKIYLLLPLGIISIAALAWRFLRWEGAAPQHSRPVARLASLERFAVGGLHLDRLAADEASRPVALGAGDGPGRLGGHGSRCPPRGYVVHGGLVALES